VSHARLGPMELPEAAIEAALGDQLGVRLHVAGATRPVRPAALSVHEWRQLDALAGTPRALAWRRGRAALKRLLGRLGADGETSALHFPHPGLSLTHSGGVALAVHVAGVGGTGVDLERCRLGIRRAARWLGAAALFAAPVEQAWLAGLRRDLLGSELVRLWTVKEALYKADLDNAGEGLADYALVDPSRRAGPAAHTTDPRRTFRYGTLAGDGAVLSVAVRAEVDHAHR
jgi:hypothetical protein